MSFATKAEVSRLKAKNFFNRFIKSLKQKKISTQVAITYALVLFASMLIANFFTNAGMRYLFHHQAARAIEISLDRMMNLDEDELNKELWNTSAAFSGVIVRVKDDTGNLISDNNPHFPSTDRMLKYVVKDRPFFAIKGYELIETRHSFFYYTEVPVGIGEQIYYIQLFKTITFEKEFLDYMSWVSFLLSMLGVILAIVAGYFFMKKVLKPLHHVTETAREISAGDMHRRLKIEDTGAEVIELSESFNFMLDNINESFARQRQFISDASHELRTPITIIDGYVQILEKFGAKNKELFDESIGAIKNATGSMKNLLETLLFLARADQGVQTLNKVDVDIEEILKSVVNSYNNSRVKFFSDGNFNMTGDPTALKKMFGVILDNAIKYSTDDVTVKLKIEGNTATVDFIDKGIGISSGDKKKIFDRFFRADKVRTKSDEDNSIGLGLPVAQWIADNHGIKFEIESELDKGTSFKCVIEIPNT